MHGEHQRRRQRGEVDVRLAEVMPLRVRALPAERRELVEDLPKAGRPVTRITSYNVCYTKLLRGP